MADDKRVLIAPNRLNLILPRSPSRQTMTNQKDIAKKQAEIVGQLQQFPIGRTNSGGRAGGMVEVVVTNPLPGQPRVVQAKCANDCPPGDVQLLKVDDGSFVALSPNAAVKTSETTTRQVSKKNPKKPPKKDEEIWPCTVCFLYSRVKPNTENLTDNGAATGDETSWDFVSGYASSVTNSYAYVARQRFDKLGDYATAQDAIDNKLKPDRLITPSGVGSGAAKDDAVAGTNSADNITIWFYIGNPADALTDGRIVQVNGPPFHPSAGSITDSGPGYCMEVNRAGIVSAIFPSEQMGLGPLTKHLRESFPELGGRIGYAGRIEKWRGMQDYASVNFLSYVKNSPSPTEPNQVPVSFPSWYNPESNQNPWLYTGSSWFQFGWPDPQYSGCASSSWVNIESSAMNAATECGASIENDQWFWGGDAAPYYGVIDRSNPSGYIGTDGMFVCWRGHLEHAGMAQSYFEAFRTYWGIAGSVTKLGSANPYGCELPNGGGYPPAPPANTSRFLSNSYGRKAEIWLKICKENLEPIEIKLPFEFAAIVETISVLGGGSMNTGSAFESGKNQAVLLTHGRFAGGSFGSDPFSLECPHATLSIDKEFAYIDILYGGERLWEEPLTLPVRPRLANMGFGSRQEDIYGSDYFVSRRLGLDPSDRSVGLYQIRTSGSFWPLNPWGPDVHPRIVKDCFSCCQSYIVKLPTKENPNPTITASQKYNKGENIALTAASLDNEFNNKFLIADYRTENISNNYLTPNYIPKADPQTHYATFGGLPALIQIIDYSLQNINQLAPVFYKSQSDWTDMDWIHYQLQESPRQYDPLNTVLPQGVVTKLNERQAMIFDLDNKFDRHARAERIMPSTGFGHSTSTAPAYREYLSNSAYPLFVSFKEQLIGNGLIENGKLSKWFRVSTASFPILGQLKRNPL
ncbi:MAG TPA: hypothetical protein VK211_24650 [Kamptonema sp.]|nr:hypothetical protein [Kamptonema sp.]